MPGLPVTRRAVRRASSTASSPVTASRAVRSPPPRRRRSSAATSASARSPSACMQRSAWAATAAATSGLRCPSAATPKPAERSMYSRPSVSRTRQPSASAQITADDPPGRVAGARTREKRARRGRREPACLEWHVGDRGRHLASLCSRSELRRTRPGGSSPKAFQRVEGDVARDLRVLLQAPERVFVPLAPEGDVDAQAVTLPHELVAELLAHAEQHLELVLARRETAFLDERERLGDHPLVVRRDRDVGAGVEQRRDRLDEREAHGRVLLVGDLGRLDVDALADAHVRAERRERGDVRERPLQVRLQDDADVVETLLAQLPVDGEGVRGRARVLHVDTHEVVPLGGAADDAREVVAAEVAIELESEPGELAAHVRAEPLLPDRFEHVNVGGDELPRLFPPRHLLAEDVDRRQPPALVQAPNDATGVGERGPRDVAAREPPDDRPGHGRKHPDDRAVEQGQGAAILDPIQIGSAPWRPRPMAPRSTPSSSRNGAIRRRPTSRPRRTHKRTCTPATGRSSGRARVVSASRGSSRSSSSTSGIPRTPSGTWAGSSTSASTASTATSRPGSATRSPTTGKASRRASGGRSPSPSSSARSSASPTASRRSASARGRRSGSPWAWFPSSRSRCWPARASAPRTPSCSGASRPSPSPGA